MTQKQRQPFLVNNVDDGLTNSDFGGGATGVAATDNAVIPRRARFTLTAASISVAAASDFGSLKLCDLPDTNLHLLGLEADLVFTKGGTTNGIVATTDLDVGIGTAAASASTLAGAMINILEKVDLDGNSLSVSLGSHTQGQSTATFPQQLGDGASNALHLNLATTNITADDTVAVTGTVDLFYIDLGNTTS